MLSRSLPTPLVSTAWLAEHLATPGLKVVDASTYLAAAGRNARAEYDAQHIAGAVFADIDWLSDETSALPHTIPSAEKFAERIGSLGISSDDAVVVYDGSGQNFSAPRLWFMLRAFGHARVAVLDGGLRRWMLDGHSVTADVTPLAPAPFTARLDAARLRDAAAVLANIGTGGEQVVDARSAGRFEGTEPEPRAGGRLGDDGQVVRHHRTDPRIAAHRLAFRQKDVWRPIPGHLHVARHDDFRKNRKLALGAERRAVMCEPRPLPVGARVAHERRRLEPCPLGL